MVVSIFEERFKGGHHNSLGHTVEIVEEVLGDKSKLQALFDTYNSNDELVRLRLANAIRRVCVEKPDWIAPYIDDLSTRIAAIDQASTQWTLAKLFQMLESQMSGTQKSKALEILKTNLESHNDWIVLNNTMETLKDWSKQDADLKEWLIPHLTRLKGETRKSVAGRARKYLKELS